MAKKKYEPKTTGRMAISHPKVLYTCQNCNRTTFREHLIGDDDSLKCPVCSHSITGEPTYNSYKEYIDSK